MSTTPYSPHHATVALHALTAHAVDYVLPAPTSIEVRDGQVVVWVLETQLDAWLDTVTWDPDSKVLGPITDRGTLSSQTFQANASLPNGVRVRVMSSLRVDRPRTHRRLEVVNGVPA